MSNDTPTRPVKFMFKDFKQYAEIMKIPIYHPSWDAFQIVWDMARSPAFADDDEEETDEETKDEQ